MEVNNICRLCLATATDDLIHIFDEENTLLKIKDIISITTGIEIHSKDIISQKVCRKCYQFSIQIFQFRSQCLKSDAYLKELCLDYVVDKKYYIPNTEVCIKGIVKGEKIPKIKPEFTDVHPIFKIHPSIITILQTNPKIQLPDICLTSNVAPIVQIEMNQVENYFKRFNLDFNLHVKNALVSVKKSKIPKFDTNEKLFKQNEALTLPKGIKISKICKFNKTKEKCDSERNDMNKNYRTPKGPAKRKRIETPSRERLSNLHSKETHCDTNTPNKRKRKLKIEKSLQGKDQDKTTSLNDTDKYRSPTRRRKLLLAENCSNQIVNVEPVNKAIPGKSQTTVHNDNVQLGISNVTGSGNDNHNYSGESESLTCVGRSVPLLVCQLCNSVQYNMSYMKKHQKKHKRCQFCKVSFRSLQNKNDHIENVCPIKKMMNDLPYVNLVKIECDRTIREMYSEAFAGFVDLIERETDSNIISDDETDFRGFPPQSMNSVGVEVLPDGDISPILLNQKEQPPIVPDVSLNDSCNSLQVSNNAILKQLSSIIRKEVEAQTELPTNREISVTGNDSAILKGLLAYVVTYNIPVKIQPGRFNVAYDYTLKAKSTKKLCFWTDLTPITIKSGTEDALEVKKP